LRNFIGIIGIPIIGERHVLFWLSAIVHHTLEIFFDDGAMNVRVTDFAGTEGMNRPREANCADL
jgi:hypothetical protein